MLTLLGIFVFSVAAAASYYRWIGQSARPAPVPIAAEIPIRPEEGDDRPPSVRQRHARWVFRPATLHLSPARVELRRTFGLSLPRA